MNTRTTLYFNQPGIHFKNALQSIDKELLCQSGFFSSFDQDMSCAHPTHPKPKRVIDRSIAKSGISQSEYMDRHADAPGGGGSSSNHLKRCGQSSVCWDATCHTCSKNEEIVQNNMRNLFEELDFVSSVNIVGGCSDAFDLWMIDTILDYISSACTGVTVHSISLKGSIFNSGLDSYYSTMSYSRLLGSASSVTIRGLEDFLYEDDIDLSRKISGAARILDLQDYYRWLACDLWPIFHRHDGLSTGLYALWPYHVCSYPRKLFDIKTSLHKTLHKVTTAAKGSRKTVDLVPHRIVSTSLHRLHLSHLERYTDCVSEAWKQRLRTASIANFSLTSSNNMYYFHGGKQEHTSSVLEWASKGMNWMQYEDLFSAHYKTGKYDKGEGILDSIPLTAMCFESPYAELDIMATYHRCRDMLQAGAYVHKLEDSAGITVDELLDATNYLEERIDLYC